MTWVQDAYNQCRKYTQFWFTSMQYLSDIELYTLREIREHVCRKLLPGQFCFFFSQWSTMDPSSITFIG